MGKLSDVRVSEREKKMPKAEKLELINQELEEFMEYCDKHGYSAEDIDAACQPLWKSIESNRWKRVVKVTVALTTSVLICIILVTVNPFARFTAAVGRELMMKMLPYWDWTQLYYEECLVSNPYYENVKLTAENCKSCEDLTRVESVSNASHGLMTHEYLYSNIPVIVTDATRDWPANKHFTSIRDLHQLHMDNDRLREGLPCELITNLNLRSYDNLLLMSRAMEGEYKKFYAIWQQCDVLPSKAMRSYIKRPYFLPPMVELVRSNWVIISKDYHGTKYKHIPLTTQLVYLAQLVGGSKVELTPNPPCDSMCHVVRAVLDPGDTLVYTSRMWNVSWLPDSSKSQVGETIAVSTGGYFD